MFTYGSFGYGFSHQVGVQNRWRLRSLNVCYVVVCINKDGNGVTFSLPADKTRWTDHAGSCGTVTSPQSCWGMERVRHSFITNNSDNTNIFIKWIVPFLYSDQLGDTFVAAYFTDIFNITEIFTYIFDPYFQLNVSLSVSQ